MMQDRVAYADSLKALIYEDYLRSMDSVRAGTHPDIAFRRHENRVSRIRMLVAATEAKPSHLRLVG